MTYTPDIPVIGDSLGGTRDRIRSNFQLIKSVFGQEHWTFGESDQGIHKRVVMPEATTSGSGIPGTNANAAGLYVDPGTNPAEANLWIRGENNGKKYQITTLNEANSGRFGKDSSTNPNGWTFLPGGLILQFGKRTGPGTSGTVLFTTSNFDFPTVCLNVFISINSPSGTITYSVDSLAKTGFDYKLSAGPTAFYWQALGY